MIDVPLAVVLIGTGATLVIDLWALFLKRGFGIASLDYCLLGRWFLHMLDGTFVHSSIGRARPKHGECAAGWVAHYSIGCMLAAVLVLVVTTQWLRHPTLLPALTFGIVTSAIPFFVMQPALGLGVAAARTPRPALARLKSLATHSVFGLGLYGMALLVRPFVR